MGRNPKQGIDYFPADVDMFQDRKIKRLLRSAGGKGFTIYIYMLTHIYRDKGYYYQWDEHSAFDISDDLNFSEAVVEETIKACCSIGLFNEALFSERSVISSESIQQRWQKIVIDANRVETDIAPSIEILDGKPRFLTKEMGKPPKETPEKSGDIPQSKGKESKEEESREKRAPGNRSNTRGKSSLSGWEDHNDGISLCREDVDSWMEDQNIDIPDAEFDYELGRFRDKFSGKRYKDWVATFRNYLRSRYLDSEHFDFKGNGRSETNQGSDSGRSKTYESPINA